MFIEYSAFEWQAREKENRLSSVSVLSVVICDWVDKAFWDGKSLGKIVDDGSNGLPFLRRQVQSNMNDCVPLRIQPHHLDTGGCQLHGFLPAVLDIRIMSCIELADHQSIGSNLPE
jgi:hypothetical protein